MVLGKNCQIVCKCINQYKTVLSLFLILVRHEAARNPTLHVHFLLLSCISILRNSLHLSSQQSTLHLHYSLLNAGANSEQGLATDNR